MRYNSISNQPFIRHRITYPYVYLDSMFTDEELDTIERYCETFNKTDAKILSEKNIQDIRRSKVSWFHYRENHLELKVLFEKLNYAIQKLNEEYYNFDLNGYDALQYTTYDENELGTYTYHIDMNTGTFKDESNSLLLWGDTRKLSLSLFLTDPSSYEGGKFTMKIGESDDDEYEVEQKRGRIVLFPSFFLHAVHPVTKGVRKSIVTWVEGPKFI